MAVEQFLEGVPVTGDMCGQQLGVGANRFVRACHRRVRILMPTLE